MEKRIALFGTAAAALMLAACGSDSSSSSNAEPASSDSVEIVASIDDLVDCRVKNAGDLAAVGANGETTNYICAYTDDKFNWVELVEIAETSEDFKKCSAKLDMFYAFAVQEESLYKCIDFEWQKVKNYLGESGSTAKSSDSQEAKSSSSKKVVDDDDDQPSGEKVVTFVKNILWQPSYGMRAYTYEEGVNEYNFGSEEEGLSGQWYKYLDNKKDENGYTGISKASGIFGDDYLTLKFELGYQNWELASGYDGLYTYYYYVPHPYPYAGFGFDLVEGQAATNIADIASGLCVTYSASYPVVLAIQSKATDSDAGSYRITLPATTGKTADFVWSELDQPSWGSSVSLGSALAKAYAIQFLYTNDESGVTAEGCDDLLSCYKERADVYGTNTVKIYQIGKMGSCGSSGASNVL